MESQKNNSYLQSGWVFTSFPKLYLTLSVSISALLFLFICIGVYMSLNEISSIGMSKEIYMQTTKDTKISINSYSSSVTDMSNDIELLDLKDVDLFQTEISGLAMKHSVILTNLNVLQDEYSGEGKDIMPPSKVATLIVEGYLRDVREFFVDLQISYPTTSTKQFKIDVIRNKIKVDVTLFLSDYKDN